MKYILIFSFFVVFSLDAAYIRSIRVGSFPNETTANQALVKLLEFSGKYPEIIELEKRSIFEIKVRKSGKYYVTVIEPLIDKNNLQKILDIIRIEYKDAYVTKLKTLPKINLSKSIEKKVVLKEKKEVITKISTPILKKEDLKPLNLKPEVHKEEIRHSQTNLTSNIFTFTFTFIFILLFIGFLFLFFTYKRKIEKYENINLMNEEKISKLKKQLSDKSNLISYVSHELRTPMTAIMGLVHLLKDDQLSLKQKDHILRIESASEHLLNLINDILDVSKIDSGELKLEKNEFNLNDILSYVIGVNAIKAKANNTSLNIEVDKDVPSKIIGDSLRIGQVLINLIGNATKFTHDGDITIKVEKISSFNEKVTLKFSVSDTGIGMTKEQVNKIFNSFYQADESTSRKFGGTGLGLSISKNLVEKMGGTINVTSKKDVGTTFFFTIDFNLKDSENKRQYRLPSGKLLNKKILIIDPSNKNVISFLNLFGYFNYEVNSIPSFEGMDIDTDEKYDILVVNQHVLTELAIQKLKEFSKNNNVKIVITSEIHSGLSSQILNQLKIDFYLEMPCTQQNILNLIVDLYVSKNLDSVPKKVSIKDKLKKLKNKKILIAEDNEINQKVISGLLSNLGIELTFVNDGREAVDIIDKDVQFDLILMDINMPNLNGYEATKIIRDNYKYTNIPILALSGDISQDDIRKSLDVGMQGHIAKPIVVDSFYKLILEHLQTSDNAAKDINKKISAHEQKIKDDRYPELSIVDGIKRCENDIEFYKSILKDFIKMYKSSSKTMEDLCVKDEFKKARKLAMDVKDVALNIGAYNVYESAASMQYEFEKGSRGNWWENISLYENALKKLFKDIDKYLKD